MSDLTPDEPRLSVLDAVLADLNELREMVIQWRGSDVVETVGPWDVVEGRLDRAIQMLSSAGVP